MFVMAVKAKQEGPKALCSFLTIQTYVYERIHDYFQEVSRSSVLIFKSVTKTLADQKNVSGRHWIGRYIDIAFFVPPKSVIPPRCL